MRVSKPAVFALGWALATGCVGAEVRKRAAADFGCPVEDVWVDAMGAGYLAYGCRQEAEYAVRGGQVQRTSKIRASDKRPPLPIDTVPGTNSIGLE